MGVMYCNVWDVYDREHSVTTVQRARCEVVLGVHTAHAEVLQLDVLRPYTRWFKYDRDKL